MKRIGRTAMLATLLVVLAGCRPTGLEPSPRSQPTADAPASQPADEPARAGALGTAADQTEQAGRPAKDEAGARSAWSYTPKTSEGRVLGAIGKAVLSSIRGDTEPPPPEAPRFGP